MATSPASGPGGGGGLPDSWTQSGSPATVHTNGGDLFVDAGGFLEIDGSATQVAPLFKVLAHDSSAVEVDSDGSGGIATIDLFNTNGAEVTLDANGDLELVANAILSLRSPVVRWRGATAAPADAQLTNSGFALWLDDTPGATALKVKAKDSGGTVRTATIPLS